MSEGVAAIEPEESAEAGRMRGLEWFNKNRKDFPNHGKKRNRRPRKRVTIEELAEFFGKDRRTMSRWLEETPIDRKDIQQVLRFVVTQALLLGLHEADNQRGSRGRMSDKAAAAKANGSEESDEASGA